MKRTFLGGVPHGPLEEEEREISTIFVGTFTISTKFPYALLYQELRWQSTCEATATLRIGKNIRTVTSSLRFHGSGVAFYRESKIVQFVLQRR